MAGGDRHDQWSRSAGGHRVVPGVGSRLRRSVHRTHLRRPRPGPRRVRRADRRQLRPTTPAPGATRPIRCPTGALSAATRHLADTYGERRAPPWRHCRQQPTITALNAQGEGPARSKSHAAGRHQNSRTAQRPRRALASPPPHPWGRHETVGPKGPARQRSTGQSRNVTTSSDAQPLDTAPDSTVLCAIWRATSIRRRSTTRPCRKAPLEDSGG